MVSQNSANAIAIYMANAADMIPRYDAIPTEDWYAPVRHLIPSVPSRIIDIGAGSGRDARWLGGKGHVVTAVDPVPAFVASGSSKGNERWITDSLPDLRESLALGEQFDLILLSAVWQHLDPGERKIAVPNICRLAAPEATILMALRHGPSSLGRPIWPIDPDETAAHFTALGCTETFRIRVPSIQAQNIADGVDWTWLALTA